MGQLRLGAELVTRRATILAFVVVTLLVLGVVLPIVFATKGGGHAPNQTTGHSSPLGWSRAMATA
ncbi:MAG TPA: hypothetical protein VE753_08340 [Gaiellaceae bacterium]|nr:hypothetical protein [Gaiellaceae bacterium]